MALSIEYLNDVWCKILAASHDEMPRFISHFTSIDAALSIIEGQKMYASHFAFLNDPQDGVLFIDSLINVIGEILKKNYRYDHFIIEEREFVDYGILNILINKENYKDIKLVLHCLGVLLKNYRSAYKTPFPSVPNKYLISFVGDQSVDHLKYWRTYGRDGRGLCLTFDSSVLIETIENLVNQERKEINCARKSDEINLMKITSAEFVRCVYVDDQFLEDECYDLMNNFQKDHTDMILSGANYSEISSLMKDLLDLIFKISITYKSSHYQDEGEYRLYFSVDRDLYEKNLKYRRVDSVIVPYIEFGWGIESLSSVFVGPRTNKRLRLSVEHLVSDRFGRRLNHRSGFRVFESTVPYVGND